MADDTNQTDRRFHAAYQRGYEGPASETANPAKKQDRRPRLPHREANPDIRRERAQPEGETRLGTDQTAGQSIRAPRSGPQDGEWTEPVPEGEVTTDLSRTDEPPTSAFDKRIPVTLALLGAVFLAIGLALTWVASSTMSDGLETPSEEFLRTLTYYIPTAALPVGLIAIGAAITLKATRS